MSEAISPERKMRPTSASVMPQGVGPTVDVNDNRPRLQEPGASYSPATPKGPNELQALIARISSIELPSDVKQRILQRISHAAPNAEDLSIVSSALRGHNAARALNGIDQLWGLISTNHDNAPRMTLTIQSALVAAVANRRTRESTGQNGIMGVAQMLEAAAAMLQMPAAQFDVLNALLSTAGTDGSIDRQSNTMLERSLILKAIAARRPLLTGANAESAMAEVVQFATDIRGEQREQLVRTTTAIDVENTTNTSRVDPLALPAADDDRADNDGLYQRFETSCVPTVAQLVKAEKDPIYARGLWREFHDASASSAIAREQLQILADPRFVEADGDACPSVASVATQRPAHRCHDLDDAIQPPGYQFDDGNQSRPECHQSNV